MLRRVGQRGLAKQGPDADGDRAHDGLRDDGRDSASRGALLDGALKEGARIALGLVAAAMLRAGHGLDMVRRILDASPGDVPDPDSC